VLKKYLQKKKLAKKIEPSGKQKTVVIKLNKAPLTTKPQVMIDLS